MNKLEQMKLLAEAIENDLADLTNELMQKQKEDGHEISFEMAQDTAKRLIKRENFQ